MASDFASEMRTFLDRDYYTIKFRQFYDTYIDNFDPWFFTKPQEFTVLDHKIHYYKPFHFKLLRITYEENPSLVTSIFLTIHAVMNFFVFMTLASLDSFFSLLSLTSTPIGEVRKPALLGFKENKKGEFLKTFIDELGKNSRDAYIHSAKDFQKAILYFPIQLPNFEVKKIFSSIKLYQTAIPILKGWLNLKKISITPLLWTACQIDKFSPSTVMKLEIKHFSKILEEIEANQEIIQALESQDSATRDLSSGKE